MALAPYDFDAGQRHNLGNWNCNCPHNVFVPHQNHNGPRPIMNRLINSEYIYVEWEHGVGTHHDEVLDVLEPSEFWDVLPALAARGCRGGERCGCGPPSSAPPPPLLLRLPPSSASARFTCMSWVSHPHTGSSGIRQVSSCQRSQST